MTNTLLNNMSVQRTVPDWRATQLVARVPMKILRQSRDYSINTPDEVIFEMLEAIGIDPIADIVSQGCFVYDIAVALEIPVIKFRQWLESDHSYITLIEQAELVSAEAYLSASTSEIMNVSPEDTDAARVAKIKADHLKWLAKVKDRDKYADQVNLKHSGGQTVEFRINTNAPLANSSNIIDV